MAWNDDQFEGCSHYHEPGFPPFSVGRDNFDCFNTLDPGLTIHKKVTVTENAAGGAIYVVAPVTMVGL